LGAAGAGFRKTSSSREPAYGKDHGLREAPEIHKHGTGATGPARLECGVIASAIQFKTHTVQEVRPVGAAFVGARRVKERRATNNVIYSRKRALMGPSVAVLPPMSRAAARHIRSAV
jgi:hypothetical protein